MRYKKFIIFAFFLIFVIVVLSFLLTDVSILTKEGIPLSISRLIRRRVSIPEKTDVRSAVEQSIISKDKILLAPKDKDICYWIKPTHNGTHYLLQMIEYKSTLGKCLGSKLSEKVIVLNRGINILGGKSCVCGNEIYELELEADGLRITKR